MEVKNTTQICTLQEQTSQIVLNGEHTYTHVYKAKYDKFGYNMHKI